MRDALRLLPDVLRVLRRLAADPSVSRSARIKLYLLLGYLVLPLDLVPDVLPLIGYADDVIIMALVLRSVVRSAGPDALRRHCPAPRPGLPSSNVSPASRHLPLTTPGPDTSQTGI